MNPDCNPNTNSNPNPNPNPDPDPDPNPDPDPSVGSQAGGVAQSGQGREGAPQHPARGIQHPYVR